MADRFKKVQAGQPLEVSSQAWNSFIDLARNDKDRKHDRDEDSIEEKRQADIVKVRNQAGVDLERFGIVELHAPIIGPADNLLEFKQRATFEVGVPQLATGNRFAVLTEPLKAGSIGHAIAAGVTLARVSVGIQPYACTEPIAGQAGYLRNVPHGPASILWMEAEGALRWSIIRIDQSNSEEIVFITSNRPDESGYFPGVVQRYDTLSKSWISQFSCKVLDANR